MAIFFCCYENITPRKQKCYKNQTKANSKIVQYGVIFIRLGVIFVFNLLLKLQKSLFLLKFTLLGIKKCITFANEKRKLAQRWFNY